MSRKSGSVSLFILIYAKPQRGLRMASSPGSTLEPGDDAARNACARARRTYLVLLRHPKLCGAGWQALGTHYAHLRSQERFRLRNRSFDQQLHCHNRDPNKGVKRREHEGTIHPKMPCRKPCQGDEEEHTSHYRVYGPSSKVLLHKAAGKHETRSDQCQE